MQKRFKMNVLQIFVIYLFLIFSTYTFMHGQHLSVKFINHFFYMYEKITETFLEIL